MTLMMMMMVMMMMMMMMMATCPHYGSVDDGAVLLIGDDKR